MCHTHTWRERRGRGERAEEELLQNLRREGEIGLYCLLCGDAGTTGHGFGRGGRERERARERGETIYIYVRTKRAPFHFFLSSTLFVVTLRVTRREKFRDTRLASAGQIEFSKFVEPQSAVFRSAMLRERETDGKKCVRGVCIPFK